MRPIYGLALSGPLKCLQSRWPRQAPSAQTTIPRDRFPHMPIRLSAAMIVGALFICVGSLAPSTSGSGTPTNEWVSLSGSYRCGHISVAFEGSGRYRYTIKVTRGRVPCRRARHVLRRFLAESKSTSGWSCFRGHGKDAWAAACGTPSEKHPTKIIKAYDT
jgi:hypothetical protein